MPTDSQSNDCWFRHIAIVVRDIDLAYRRLLANEVELISDSPQTLPDWNKDAAGISALYFRDPDGHPLELIQFPPDKGNALWHTPGETLFLGVDHTAIVVSQTERSLAFYRDRLGFVVKGKAHNHGVEQERLSDVSSPSVHITTLAGGGLCGIELLEYSNPANGRSQPADTTNLDAWWATTLCTSNTDARDETISRDPDGHGVEWI